MYRPIEFRAVIAKTSFFPILCAIFERPNGLFWARYSPHACSGVCAYVKSFRSQKLDVLSAQFRESFPTPMKPTHSQLVLTRVDSLNQFPIEDEICLQFVHRFFSSVSLTSYCIHPGVARLGPEDHTDVPAHRISSCNCKNFLFSNLVSHFLGPKRPFLGSILSARVLGRVRVCKIFQIAKIRSPISSIPRELSNAYENDSIGARSHSR